MLVSNPPETLPHQFHKDEPMQSWKSLMQVALLGLSAFGAACDDGSRSAGPATSGARTDSNNQPKVSNDKQITETSSDADRKKPVWIYNERIDPISKAAVATVKGNLSTIEITPKPMRFEFLWSCPESTVESAQVTISTFWDETLSGKWEGLDLHYNAAGLEFRFDGVPLSGLRPYRDYSNAVTLHIMATRDYGDKGLVTYKKGGELTPTAVKDFYLTDYDFVVRLPTANGPATAEFSLDDPALRRLLTACGFTYGQPPPKKSRNAGKQ
jgi:hypothetical protein